MKTYGETELTVSSPAQSFIEPIDTRQVRTWLGLPETDPDEDQDALLIALISAARNVAELHQHRELAVKQYDLRLDSFPSEIELPPPLQSVELVQYTDSTSTVTALTEGTDYIVDTARNLIVPVYGGSWPTATLYPSGAVLVRFTSGYPPSHPFWSNDGQPIIQGMRLLITLWHENRLPFTPPGSTLGEPPFAVTALLSMGARLMVH